MPNSAGTDGPRICGVYYLDDIISEIETRSLKVPVLLRQYIAMNANIICFNIDPKFADCLDGFLVMDFYKVPQEMLDKLAKNL